MKLWLRTISGWHYFLGNRTRNNIIIIWWFNTNQIFDNNILLLKIYAVWLLIDSECERVLVTYTQQQQQQQKRQIWPNPKKVNTYYNESVDRKKINHLIQQENTHTHGPHIDVCKYVSLSRRQCLKFHWNLSHFFAVVVVVCVRRKSLKKNRFGDIFFLRKNLVFLCTHTIGDLVDFWFFFRLLLLLLLARERCVCF